MHRVGLCSTLRPEAQPRKRAQDHVGLPGHSEQPKLPRLSDGDSDLQRGPERIGSLVPHAPGGGHATFRNAATDDICNSSVSAEGRPVARTLSHDTAACIPLSPDASLGGIAGRAGSRCGTHVERPLHLCSRVELLHAMQQLNESEIVIREELRTLRQGYEATMSSFKNDALNVSVAHVDVHAGPAAKPAGAQPHSPPSASQGPLPPRPPRATPTRQQLGHHEAPISSTALQHEALARAPPPTQRQAQPSSRAPSAAHTASHQLLQQQQQQLLLRQALAQVQAEQRGQRSMPPPSGGAAAQRAAGAAAGPPVSASPRRVSASAQVGSSAGPWRGEAPSAGPAGRPRLEAPAMDPAIGAALMRLLQQQAEMLRA